MKPVIYLAADHAGFEHKSEIYQWLLARQYEVQDCGAFERNPEDDFPDFIEPAAQAVAKNPQKSKAIIFGGSGQGEAMLANRYKGVRACVFYGGPSEIVQLSRQHNDANIVSIGARFVSVEECKTILTIWLETEAFGDEKYARRNAKIAHITKRLRGLFSRT